MESDATERPPKPRRFKNAKQSITRCLCSCTSFVSGFLCGKPSSNDSDANHISRLYSTPGSGVNHDTQVIKAARLPLLWVVGGPGAPIQAFVQRVARLYNFHHVFIGNIMQQEIKLGTRRKDIAHELMSRGIILPRTFLIEIIKRDMSEAIRIKNVQGFIFSDYPVTLPQAKTFIKKISPLDFAIVFKFDEHTMKLNAFNLLWKQSSCSRHLRKNKNQLRKAAAIQVNNYVTDLTQLYTLLGNKLKVIDGHLDIKAAFLELMRWTERAMIIHNMMPPYQSDPPIRHPKKRLSGSLTNTNDLPFSEGGTIGDS